MYIYGDSKCIKMLKSDKYQVQDVISGAEGYGIGKGVK